jgi:ABC-type lipoprotein release transport system permease subunit
MRPGLWVRLAARFLQRSWRSTLVLGVMVLTATAALVFLAALAVGTNDAMVRNSVGLFTGHVAGRDLPPGLDPAALQGPGVQEILVRRELGVVLQAGTRMAAVDLVGVDPEAERRRTALWRKTAAGRYLQPQGPDIYLGAGVARDLGAEVGRVLTVLGTDGALLGERVVCGVFRTGIPALDGGLAFVPLAGWPAPEGRRTAAVFLEDGAGAEEEAARLSRLPGAPEFQAWSDFMPDLKQLIDLNYVSMGIVMVLVFGVVSLGIACAFVIFILKNLREHGILKAMGVRPLESAALILLQVGGLTVAAAAAGTAAGAAAVLLVARTGIDLGAFTSHNPYFVVSGVIVPRLTAYSLGAPPLLALGFGLLAAVWPVAMVVRQRAAQILRSL